MKITIYGSRRQQPYYEDIRSLIYGLVENGVDIYMHNKLYDHLSGELGMSLVGVNRVYNCPPEADLAISLGGDGTFLRTVDWLGLAPWPILGINTGHLGFLTAITLTDAVANINKILDIDFRTEQLTMLQVETEAATFRALNEVVVAKDESASMITASVFIDTSLIADYKSDGVIIATPTGSTAYNLSVGGPIIQPSTPALVISPIAAHSLTLRPLVVNHDSVIDINVTGRTPHFRLVVDGRPCSLPMGSSVRISKALHSVAMLQPRERDFATIIREKLSFNG